MNSLLIKAKELLKKHSKEYVLEKMLKEKESKVYESNIHKIINKALTE